MTIGLVLRAAGPDAASFERQCLQACDTIAALASEDPANQRRFKALYASEIIALLSQSRSRDAALVLFFVTKFCCEINPDTWNPTTGTAVFFGKRGVSSLSSTSLNSESS